MSERKPEDRLREEYFTLLPDIRRVLEELEAEVRYALLPVSNGLLKYEKIAVASRIKDCESALGALRRRQEGNVFDRDRADSYTLTSLNDLAGVRVLAFPRSRWTEVNNIFRDREPFKTWSSDPILADGSKEPLVFKYHGHCSRSSEITAELQIAPMLIGLFWEVEHSAIYKPLPRLRAALSEPTIKKGTGDVYAALKNFEDEFERLIRRDPSAQSSKKSPRNS